MFVHAVKNSVQPENYHFPRGHIYQGYHFRFFDAPGLVPPVKTWFAFNIYLSSDEASFITGSTIHINGGMGMF